MNNAGVFNLGDAVVTAAETDKVITSGSNSRGATRNFIGDLKGMTAVTLECKMVGGTGGTSINVIVSTSLDGGQTEIDIANFRFTNTAAVKAANLSGLLSKAIAAVAALGNDAVLDGVLGDRLKARYTSVGTYTDTTVAVRASVR